MSNFSLNPPSHHAQYNGCTWRGQTLHVDLARPDYKSHLTAWQAETEDWSAAAAKEAAAATAAVLHPRPWHQGPLLVATPGLARPRRVTADARSRKTFFPYERELSVREVWAVPALPPPAAAVRRAEADAAAATAAALTAAAAPWRLPPLTALPGPPPLPETGAAAPVGKAGKKAAAEAAAPHVERTTRKALAGFLHATGADALTAKATGRALPGTALPEDPHAGAVDFGVDDDPLIAARARAAVEAAARFGSSDDDEGGEGGGAPVAGAAASPTPPATVPADEDEVEAGEGEPMEVEEETDVAAIAAALAAAVEEEVKEEEVEVEVEAPPPSATPSSSSDDAEEQEEPGVRARAPPSPGASPSGSEEEGEVEVEAAGATTPSSNSSDGGPASRPLPVRSPPSSALPDLEEEEEEEEPVAAGGAAAHATGSEEEEDTPPATAAALAAAFPAAATFHAGDPSAGAASTAWAADRAHLLEDYRKKRRAGVRKAGGGRGRAR